MTITGLSCRSDMEYVIYGCCGDVSLDPVTDTRGGGGVERGAI